MPIGQHLLQHFLVLYGKRALGPREHNKKKKVKRDHGPWLCKHCHTVWQYSSHTSYSHEYYPNFPTYKIKRKSCPSCIVHLTREASDD